MATSASTFSILLLVSLLSLFTTRTVAHNRFPLPPSCIGNPSLLKCAIDFEFALKAAASSETHISAGALTVVLNSINAAKAAGASILHFLPIMDGGLINVHPKIGLVKSLNSTIGIAINQLIQASTVI
jgi:hypothetical protein